MEKRQTVLESWTERHDRSERQHYYSGNTHSLIQRSREKSAYLVDNLLPMCMLAGFHFHLQGAFNSCYHQAFALCFQSFWSHTRTEIFRGWCWMSLRMNRPPALSSRNEHLPLLLPHCLSGVLSSMYQAQNLE